MCFFNTEQCNLNFPLIFSEPCWPGCAQHSRNTNERGDAVTVALARRTNYAAASDTAAIRSTRSAPANLLARPATAAAAATSSAAAADRAAATSTTTTAAGWPATTSGITAATATENSVG